MLRAELTRYAIESDDEGFITALTAEYSGIPSEGTVELQFMIYHFPVSVPLGTATVVDGKASFALTLDPKDWPLQTLHENVALRLVTDESGIFVVHHLLPTIVVGWRKVLWHILNWTSGSHDLSPFLVNVSRDDLKPDPYPQMKRWLDISAT